MKHLLFTPFLLFFLLTHVFAQDREFLRSDFSLIESQDTADAKYYRVPNDQQPNTYIIYDLSESDIGKEEIDRQEGLISRKLILVYPNSTPKEIHLLEESKFRVTRSSEFFHENGNLQQEERDIDGLLQNRIKYNEKGIQTSEDEIIIAAPKGGLDAWYDHLSKNLKYPLWARRMGAQGIVYTRFDVNEEGEASNYEVLKTAELHPDLIKESLRVTKAFGNNWLPYSINGKKLSSQVTLPIKFVLN